MLRLKSLLFAAVILLASNAAMASENNKEPKTFKQTFTKAMSSIDFANYEVPNDRVYIEFMVNEDQEVIILATSAKSVDSIIKSKMNYVQLDNQLTPHQKYTIKVLIER